MQRIEGQIPDRRNMAVEILSWVTCARRPLTTLELQHALAVELGESKFHDDNLPDLDDIISVCAGLITVTADSMGDTVRLVHYTTKEYFERKWTSWFPDAHNSIATICVTYVSFEVFQKGICSTDREFETRLDQYPLYSYAARNWGHHARAQPINENFLMAFLGDRGKVNACAQEIFALNGFSSHGDYSQRVPLGFTGLHLAAYFGLKSVVQSMIRQCDQFHVRDSMGRTPFVWAVYAGHEEVVKLFLEHGVDTHKSDSDGRTPISLAASAGWIVIVNILLDHHVDPDSRDIDDQTPLSWSAYRGHNEVARLLVKRGANPDSKDEYGKTPLSWAAADGWVEIAQFLLEQSIDIDSKDVFGRTPLSWAVENGHAGVVRLLLERGAQRDSEDAEGHTPLFWAAHYGHEVVLQVLQIRPINPSLWVPVMDSTDFALQNTELSSPQKASLDQNEPIHGSELRCPLCFVQFWSSRSRGSFRRHVENRHYPRFSYYCVVPSCKQPFPRLDQARVHCQTVHGTRPELADLREIREEESLPSNCPLCPRCVKSWDEFFECVLNHAQDPSSSNRSFTNPEPQKGRNVMAQQNHDSTNANQKLL